MKIKLLKTTVIDGSVEFPFYEIDVQSDEMAQKLIDQGLAEAVPVAIETATVIEKVAPEVKRGKARKAPENGQRDPGQADDQPGVAQPV
jgi:hypothetical protein